MYDIVNVAVALHMHGEECADMAVGIDEGESAGGTVPAELSDGAIVGSAIIKYLEKYGKDAPKYIGEYVKSMKDAI